MRGFVRLLCSWALFSSIALADFPVESYKSFDRTNPILEVEKSGQPLGDGYLFFIPAQRMGNPPFIMTDDGDLVWAGPRTESGNGLEVQQLNGRRILTLFEGQNSPFGFHYGGIQIIDSTYAVTQIICPHFGLYIPNFSSFSAPPTCEADAHEGAITHDGTIMVTAYNTTRTDLTAIGGPENGWTIDSQFYEIDISSGDILFTWKSLNHVPVTDTRAHVFGTQGQMDVNPFDYFHINAVQKLANGHYFVCSRNTGAVYYIGLNGKIIWTFNGLNGGDFSPLPKAPHKSDHFSFQHDAKIQSIRGTKFRISMFNNNNSGKNVKLASNGLLFELDTADMSSKLLKRFYDPDHTLKSWKEGNYQSLPNGNVLISYGSVTEIVEFGGNNATDVRMRIKYGDKDATYRAFRQKWHATPSTRPSVFVSTKKGLGFVSWNGATDVLRYVLHAGTTKNNLQRAGGVRKTGFETTFVLPASVRNGGFLRVDAYKGSQKLRSSEVIKF